MTFRDHIIAVVIQTPGIGVAALQEAVRARRGSCPREALDNELTRAKRAGLIEYRKSERGWFALESGATSPPAGHEGCPECGGSGAMNQNGVDRLCICGRAVS